MRKPCLHRRARAIKKDEMTSYAELLKQRIATVESSLCVGLDPRPERTGTIREVEAHLRGVIDETQDLVACYKPNLAYFEAMGIEGLQLLERLLKEIPARVPVILDAKRSDIGETQKYYAKAYFEYYDVDAVTLNPFMGYDSIEPYLNYEGKGIYLLALTSNPGSKDLMRKESEGRPLYLHVSDYAERAKDSPCEVGFVMGLTSLGKKELDQFPDYPLLIPGLGSQGGDLSVLQGGTKRKAPNVVNVSRAILFPEHKTHREVALEYSQKLRESEL